MMRSIHGKWCTPDELIIRLYTGRETSVRIDECIMFMSRIAGDDFCLFRVVKKCQYSLDEGRLVPVD